MHEQPSNSETFRSVESRPDYPYSAIIVLPYTSRIQGVNGQDIIEGRTANIRLSSYSAMVVEAARMEFNSGAAPFIIVTGENTFGKNLPSTADLMKRQLTRDLNKGKPKEQQRQIPDYKKPVPESAVIALSGLQDTDQQIEGLNKVDPHLLANPIFIVMKFHHPRVLDTMRLNNIKGDVEDAEEIMFFHLIDKFPEEEKSEKEFAEYRNLVGIRLEHFTTPQFQNAEDIVRLIYEKPMGRSAVKLIRVFRGQTVTDIQSLTTAKKHKDVAQKAIREGTLKPGDITT